MTDKICADCKYHKPFMVLSGYCSHPKNLKKDLVSGELTLINSCRDLRETKSKKYCGKNANWFEQKEQKAVDIKETIAQPSPMRSNPEFSIIKLFKGIFKHE